MTINNLAVLSTIFPNQIFPLFAKSQLAFTAAVNSQFGLFHKYSRVSFTCNNAINLKIFNVQNVLVWEMRFICQNVLSLNESYDCWNLKTH